MQTTEKNTSKIWLSIISIGVVIAIILGAIALINSWNPMENFITTLKEQEKVSAEVKGNLDTLETTVEELQTDLNVAIIALDALETEAYGKGDVDTVASLNQLKTDMIDISEKLDATYKAIEKMKTTDGLSEKEIASQVEGLQEDVIDLQRQVADINPELDALASAIFESEASMRAWVNEELETLYNKIATLQQQVDALDSSEVTDDELDTKLDAIRTKITDLENLVSDLERLLEEQEKNYSIHFMPTYSDGKAVMDYQTKTATINFLTNGVWSSLDDSCCVQAYLCYMVDPSNRTSNDATMLEWKELEVISFNTIMPTDSNNLYPGSRYVLQVNVKGMSYVTDGNGNNVGLEELSNDFWSGNIDAILYIQVNSQQISDVVPLVVYGYNP